MDGSPFDRLSPGGIAMLGAMGDETARPGPDRRYMDSMPFGACDPTDRIAWLDKEQLDAVVLYPTIGIIWESGVDDVELSDAYTRAYNRWIADFCRDSRGRLVPIAHLSLSDPERAARELERAVADGCRARSSCRSRGRASRTAIPTTTCCGRRRPRWASPSASTRATSPTSRTR